MTDKQMDQFDLSKIPASLPAQVKGQVQEIKQKDPRLGEAMESIEPQHAPEGFKGTVFEAPNFKVNALGKVFGANVRAKF